MTGPLVSIIVITYNSAKYVFETLQSIKLQTYENKELIISDDASTDNTVDICRNWVEENKNWFIDIRIIAVSENSGIPSNCNRGIKAAKGEWIKLIAGDDALLGTCIEKNIEFVSQDNSVQFLFSKGMTFNDSGELIAGIGCDKKKMQLDSHEQYKELLKSGFVLTPSAFINKDALLNLGGYNESIPLMEDYPLWLKATKNGYKLHYLDEETVLYRVHCKSASNKLIKPVKIKDKQKWMITILEVYDQETMKDIKKFRMFYKYYHIHLLRKSCQAYLDKNYFKYNFFLTVKFLDPVYLVKMAYRYLSNIPKSN